jgi:hypothetical protein
MYEQRGGFISLLPSPEKGKQDKYAYDKNCLVFVGLSVIWYAVPNRERRF